ncbi:MAG TPA: DUF4169 family protein [Xanthobacteraceae bacterium]|nr:DUF4169 family protein [Xanthobacteraceae bacterium]
MGEVLNLRCARKARGHAEAARGAAENRARFGRAKAERHRDAAEKARRDRELDRAHIAPGGEDR